RLSARVTERLRHELFFRLEVRVEPAVRQAGAAHDVTDPDRRDALRPERPRGGVQNPLTRLRLVSARPWHNNMIYIIFSNHDATPTVGACRRRTRAAGVPRAR